VGHAPPPAGDLSVAAWRESAPRLAAEYAERWDVALGAPFPTHPFSYVAPAVRGDGTPAVLKLTFPEPEAEHEGAALAHWAGAGAVRLLRHDPARRALLVERCEPGTTLWALGDEEEANAIAAGVLRALWAAPAAEGAPFRALAGEARRWAAELPARWERQGRPFERALLDRATGWVGELLDAPDPPVVVHQDLHGGNVLRAAREPSPSTAGPGQSPLGGKPGGPWLAIDPKPLLGERAFDVASLLRDRRPELVADPAPARRVRRRLDQLAAELDVDRERARRWGVVHALAWGVADDAVFPEIVACAGWLVEA
jgi:streptomycin 6-kinase